MTKTHWKKLQNPDYLGAYSLADTNGKYTEQFVTITKVELKRVKGLNNKEEDCITCWFKQYPKPMILNATNCKQLVKLTGSEFIENWVGKSVTLYVSKVRAFGENVDALRIKEARNQPKEPEKEELNPSHPKWEGAVMAVKSGTTTVEAIETKYKISEENKKLLIEGGKNDN